MPHSTTEKPIPLAHVRRMDSPKVLPSPSSTSLRSSEQNWARVRARMIGPLKDPQLPHTPTEEPARILQAATSLPSSGSVRGPSSQLRKGRGVAVKPQTPGTARLTEQQRASTFSSTSSTAVETTGTFSSGLRGVLGFRAVVEQRTHLRRMEKEIEKILSRHATDSANYQWIRAATRIRSDTTRGLIPGAPYPMTIPPTEDISPDMAFLTDLSDTLSRWKNLTVEVPFKEDILKEFAQMLRADRPNVLSGNESARVLDLYERMRALYPFVSDINDLSDVTWLLSLLSREYACDKQRVWGLIQALLVKLPSSPTLPLSSRNIHLLLSCLLSLLAEQRSLSRTEQDPVVQDVITNLMSRLEKGDLALGTKKHQQKEEAESKARIVFLQALIECLQAQNTSVLTILAHELIPKHWESTSASEAYALDEAASIFAEAFSELILRLPISTNEHSEVMKNILIDLSTFMTKSLPPAGLEGTFSEDTVDALIRTTLMLFSIQYCRKPSAQYSTDALSEHMQESSGHKVSDPNAALPHQPTHQHPLDAETNDQPPPSPHSRKSPASPKVSGENFIPRIGSTSQDHTFIHDEPDPLLKLTRRYFDELWDQGYHNKIIRQVRQQIESAALPRVVQMYHKLSLGSRDVVSNPILKETLGTFFNKLTVHQPPKEENLTRLLRQLSTYRRTAFFRPMMACVASDSTQTVTDYLCVLTCLQRHLSPVDIFMRDADMICVIIMTDVGHDRPTKGAAKQELHWGSCTVGQCIIVLEFIHAIKQLARSNQHHDIEVGKMFLIELERKLGMYLIAKRNLRNAQAATMPVGGGEAIPLKDTPVVNGGTSYKKFSTFPGQVSRLDRFLSLELDESVALLTALITVQSTIMTSEYIALASPLWNTYLLDSRPKVASSASFLFVKCADVAPKMVFAMVTNELYGPEPMKRLATVERLKEIFSYRNVLMSQPFVIDPSSKGPFRQTTTQLPFVPSEVGSNRYTMDEPRWLTKLKDASNFPADIRNRFQEMNWGEKDKNEIELIRREQTPLALLWSGYLDEEYESLHNFGKAFTTQPKSKHAAVVIPVINSLNMSVIDLIDDVLVGVRTMARVFMQDYMRNEPVLFLRFFFTEIAYADLPRQVELYNRLHTLLSSTSQLPPGFAFGLFNHLFGLLRWYQKSGRPLASEQLEAVIPLLAAVVASTNDIVLKDFRRNKLDQFLGTLGSFWFRSGLHPESMFPTRFIDSGNQINHLNIPLEVFRMSLISINQIHFMTNFLVRYPSELYNINRNIGQYYRMPKLDAGNTPAMIEASDYMANPERSRLRYAAHQTPEEQTTDSLGALRARMWLRFVFKLFKRFNKNYADRLQLMNLFDGVNAILLEYGHDFAILGQALDVYLTAATQMRRFFAYHNGYNLIFPALFKVYCDAERLPRVCDTLNAVFHRLYLLHQEAFVLQSLGSIVPLMLRQSKETEASTKVMARRLFAFFEALADPNGTYTEALGLQSLAEPLQNMGYGKAILELPQWMASFIPQHSRLFQTSTLMYREDFQIEDACKLFLSVIAFDPGSLRSEQFTRVYQLMLPYFWAHHEDLVRRGFSSLITLYGNFSKSSKPLVSQNFKVQSMLPRNTRDALLNETSRFALVDSYFPETLTVKGKPWAQNDRVAIKHEFLVLLQVYCKLGGRLTQGQCLEANNIARSIVRDYHSINASCSTDWLKDYVQEVLLAGGHLKERYNLVVHFVYQFVPLFKTHYLTMDWTGFLQSLCLIASDSRQYLRARVELARVIHEKIVCAGLTLGLKDDWWKEGNAGSHSKFCESLIHLIVVLINHSDMDTIHELERMSGSPTFMAYFVIPICLRFHSNYHTRIGSEVISAQFWLRMLGLVIRACEHDSTLIVRGRGRASGLLAPVLSATKNAIRRNSVDMTSPRSPRVRRSTAPAIPQTPGLAPTTPNPFSARPHDVTFAQDFQSPRVPSTPHPYQHNQPHARQQTATSAQPTDSPRNAMNATPAFIINFIALRIILVRGERYITAQPGYWLAIFQFVQRYFAGQYALLDYYTLATFTSQARAGMGGTASNPSTPMPMTPVPVTPYPTTPSGERGSISFFHLTPQERAHNGQPYLSSPMSGEPMSATTPFRGERYDSTGAGLSDVALDMLPTTSLGFVLWSFLETVMYARLPLMALMRPFMYEQLGLIDSYSVVTRSNGGENHGYWASSSRGDRSANSSGQNTPAFYWPSPSVSPLPGSQSPLHGYHPSGRSSSFHGSHAQFKGRDSSHLSPSLNEQGPDQRRTGRRERREQWKSWRNQSDTIQVPAAVTAVPCEYSTTSVQSKPPLMSRLSRMSISLKSPLQDWKFEHFPATPSKYSASRLFGRRASMSQNLPQASVVQDNMHSSISQQPIQTTSHRTGSKSNLFGSDSSAADVPAALVERANRSLRHVRVMLLGSEDAKVDFSLIQSSLSSSRFLRSSSMQLSAHTPTESAAVAPPSPLTPGGKAVENAHLLRPFVAGSSSFSSLSAYPQHDRQFLVPGERYERPPVSPGFGSMFLAREAALRAATSSGDVPGGIGSSSMLPIPSSSPSSNGISNGAESSTMPNRKTSFEVPHSAPLQGSQAQGSLLNVPSQGSLQPSSSLLLSQASLSPSQLSPASAASLPLRRSESHTSAVSSLAGIAEEPEGQETQSPPTSLSPFNSPIAHSPRTQAAVELAVAASTSASVSTSPSAADVQMPDRFNLPMLVVNSPSVKSQGLSEPSPSEQSHQQSKDEKNEEEKEKKKRLLPTARKAPQHLSVITSLPVINIHASEEVDDSEEAARQIKQNHQQPSLLPAVEVQALPTSLFLPPRSPSLADMEVTEKIGSVFETPKQRSQQDNNKTVPTTITSTPIGEESSASQTPKKKRRSILKPRIITTPTPQLEIPSIARAGISGAPAAVCTSPMTKSPYPEASRKDGETDTEAATRKTGVSPDILTMERDGYQMCGRQARIQVMMKALEEETRLIMATFPAVFVPGYQKMVAQQEKESSHQQQQQQSQTGNGNMSSVLPHTLQTTSTRESDQTSSVVPPLAAANHENRSMTSLGPSSLQPQGLDQDAASGSERDTGPTRTDTQAFGANGEPGRTIAPGVDPELNPVIFVQSGDDNGIQGPSGGARNVQQLHPTTGSEGKKDGRRYSRLSFSLKGKQKNVAFQGDDSQGHSPTGAHVRVSTSHSDGRPNLLEPGTRETLGKLNGTSSTRHRRNASSTTSLPRLTFSNASPPSPEHSGVFESSSPPVRDSALISSKSDGQLLSRAPSTGSRSSRSSSLVPKSPPRPTTTMQYPTISVSEPADSETTSTSVNGSSLNPNIPLLHAPTLPPSSMSKNQLTTPLEDSPLSQKHLQ
ncbi:hypothetical protein BGW42_000115 [Actinomortierella wolfii]|nr:hypothetical protein BGW42_000115 [Actinomortierella wolfii]